MPKIRVGATVQPEHASMERMRAAWKTVDASGADTLWTWDHFFPLSGDLDGMHHDNWTALGAMAEVTKRVQIGCLVADAAIKLGMNVLGHDPEIKQLSAQLDKVKASLDWLRRNPDGGEILNAKGDVTLTVSADEAAEYRAQYEEQANELRVLRSVRSRELKAQTDSIRAQANQILTQRFEWAKDEASPQMENIRQIEGMVPEITRLPGWKLLVAHGLEGLAAAAKNGAPAKAKTQSPPKVAVPQGQAAPKQDQGQKALRDAEAAFAKSGRSEDWVRVQSMRRALRRAA